MSKQHLILQQQVERSEQQLLQWTKNIMLESSQLVSRDYFYMFYTCRLHSFTLERRPREVNHVRYGVQHQVYEATLNDHSYPIELQFATVLWRFANTNFEYRLAEQFLDISAGSYTRFTMRFITAMSDYFDKLVNWGVYDSETTRRKAAGFEQPERRGVRLPDVIGAIDGKLISIQKPSLHGNFYVDCHNNSSVIVLAVLFTTFAWTTSQVRSFGAYADGDDDNVVEIAVEDLDPFLIEIPVDLKNASRTVNRSVRQLQICTRSFTRTW
ncbi:hypothetical protein J3Q64DRAFT_1835575 [Phycomyces blakesleeanus]|uniref:DDE Tnp4 domain-containing protein n=2 Tax=Phycomyces blakesleeanus TaxID=4837 RepID=A0A162UQJ6_PHYB8|nr:hypothetical protein PHYBLDRAFT_142627 [Phycomyces blakesleeanus NRRL 1555(-)]OAD77113.1 hypothetical protein PHYBLDRAFT_142627 [Phycomyces blakesleeanus NRRL 1555(-)]|eukprot:XP_018295153.1 hypothetical protein PHYBLDRAFT_142627 [Phycomyces blakesleeanus NRRL 1555(-)]